MLTLIEQIAICFLCVDFLDSLSDHLVTESFSSLKLLPSKRDHTHFVSFRGEYKNTEGQLGN